MSNNVLIIVRWLGSSDNCKNVELARILNISCHIRKALSNEMLYCFILFIHGSVHRNSILIRSNEMQQYAGIYLLQNYSTCFGCLSHPSSGVHKTVTAASGTIWPRWRKVVAQIL